MEHLSLYYDHYKDTFEQLKCYLAKRNQLTLVLLVLAIIVVGFIFDPSSFEEKIGVIIDSQIESLVFDFHFINTGVILILFWYLLQYYLIVLQIEKTYTYLAECEKRLTDAIPDFPIHREGAFYLKSYPWLKDIADCIFVLGFPIAFIVLSIAKIINEYSWTTALRYVDFIILGLIILFSLLYISNRRLREEYWNKKNYNLKWYQRLLGYLRIKNINE